MEKPIIQPNSVTEARYSLSVIQKNIVYHIIGALQDKMTREETIFGEQVFEIALKKLDNNRNYSRIKKELENLRYKSVEYIYMNEKGREVETVSALVSAFKHERGSDHVQVLVPSFALPFLCQIEKGFTQYRKTIAISLKSKHSKRLYELCCKYISGANAPGGFKKSIDDLKTMFHLEGKYPRPAEFKKFVLEVAYKELKEKADVWFEYSVKKAAKGDYYVNFKLFTKDARHQNNTNSIENTSNWYTNVFNYLRQYVYGHESDKAQQVTNFLQESDQLRKFHMTLMKSAEAFSSGKIKGKDHFKNTLKKALREDYDIK